MPISATASTTGEDPRLLEATRIVHTLQARGFTAYFAGGCVRDSLLGIKPSDYDVATDASPEQIIQVFGPRNTLLVGAAFGVICVHGHIRGERVQVEVATFRSDGVYLDGRRPSSVRFASVAEDAARRDFTINGMYFDPIAGRLHDLVGGEDDLRSGIVRAIGDARARIAEDKLRMIRAVRFAARFGFSIEPETAAAVRDAADSLAVVSGERLADELRKICGAQRAAWAFERLREFRLLHTLWPQLASLWDGDPAAAEDNLAVIAAIQPCDMPTVLGAMGYELSKRRGMSAARTIDELTERLKLSRTDARRGVFAASSVDTLLAADQLRWSSVQPIAASPEANSALAVAQAFANVRGLPTSGLELVRHRRSQSHPQLDPPPLLRGDDLKQLGLEPGPLFREILDKLRRLQLDEVLRDRDAAVTWVRQQANDADRS